MTALEAWALGAEEEQPGGMMTEICDRQAGKTEQRAIFDAEQAREAVEALTPLRCGICRYPVMAAWRYCPGCGTQLVWDVARNIKK